MFHSTWKLPKQFLFKLSCAIFQLINKCKIIRNSKTLKVTLKIDLLTIGSKLFCNNWFAFRETSFKFFLTKSFFHFIINCTNLVKAVNLATKLYYSPSELTKFVEKKLTWSDNDEPVWFVPTEKTRLFWAQTKLWHDHLQLRRNMR